MWGLQGVLGRHGGYSGSRFGAQGVLIHGLRGNGYIVLAVLDNPTHLFFFGQGGWMCTVGQGGKHDGGSGQMTTFFLQGGLLPQAGWGAHGIGGIQGGREKQGRGWGHGLGKQRAGEGQGGRGGGGDGGGGFQQAGGCHEWFPLVAFTWVLNVWRSPCNEETFVI